MEALKANKASILRKIEQSMVKDNNVRWSRTEHIQWDNRE